MDISEKLNKILQAAWEEKIDLKGIIINKKHKKSIEKSIPKLDPAHILEDDKHGLVTIIYQ